MGHSGLNCMLCRPSSEEKGNEIGAALINVSPAARGKFLKDLIQSKELDHEKTNRISNGNSDDV